MEKIYSYPWLINLEYKDGRRRSLPLYCSLNSLGARYVDAALSNVFYGFLGHRRGWEAHYHSYNELDSKYNSITRHTTPEGARIRMINHILKVGIDDGTAAMLKEAYEGRK